MALGVLLAIKTLQDRLEENASCAEHTHTQRKKEEWERNEWTIEERGSEGKGVKMADTSRKGASCSMKNETKIDGRAA